MATKLVQTCDCGQVHEDVLGKIGFVTEAFEANASWDACPTLIESFLAVLPENDPAAARVREGLRKLEGQRAARTQKEAAALDAQLRALTRP